LPQRENKWGKHIMLPVPRMKLKGWMFIWEFKDRTPMAMEEIDKEGNMRNII
jgi:hypothetical protein